MKENKAKIIKYFCISFWVFVLFAYLFIVLSYGREELYYPESEKLTYIKQNIDLKTNDKNSEIVNLPVNREGSNTYSYTFKIKPPKNDSSMYLKINTAYLSYTITCNDELIYAYVKNNAYFVKSMGYNLALIKLDDKYLNKDLMIEFKSNIDGKYTIEIPYIVSGEKAVLIGHILKSNIIEFISAFLLFFTAIYLIISAGILMALKLPYAKILILSIFSFITGLYLIFMIEVSQYYFQNSILCYLFDYTMLNLLLLPILLLILNLISNDKDKKFEINSLKFLSLLICANTIIQWLLTITSISEFRFMRTYTFILFITASLISLWIIFSLDKNKYKYKKYILISISPVNFVVILNIIMYNHNIYKEYQNYIAIMSILFFLVVQYIYAVKQYVDQHNTTIRSSFYKELAYYDSLTGLYNSHAFDRDMKKLRSQLRKYKTISFTMIDLNNLKEINDTFGHNIGDLYLKAISNLLLDISKTDTNINAYRYSGDEFYLVIFDNNYSYVEKIIKKIVNQAKESYVENIDTPLSFAYGTEFADISNNFDLGSIMKSADKKMYENKRKMKGNKTSEKYSFI